MTSFDAQVRLQDLAAYSAYRIRVAATGIVLVVAAFLTTLPAWITDAPSSLETVGGNGRVDMWNLWAISSGSAGAGWGRIGSAERGPATWVAFLLIVTLLLSLIAAVEAGWAWALAAGIGCAATFFVILILRAAALGDYGDQAGPNFYAAGSGVAGAPPPGPDFYAVAGGLAGAAWLMVFLAIWALVVLRTAWSKRGLREMLSP